MHLSAGLLIGFGGLAAGAVGHCCCLVVLVVFGFWGKGVSWGYWELGPEKPDRRTIEVVWFELLT